MTQRLLPGSPRIAAAMAFGMAMTVAMKRRGVGKRPLSVAAGVGMSAIGEYRRGRNLPTRAVAGRIAHALGTPSLLTIVEDARRGACSTCGVVVWQEYGRPTLYCSIPCRVIGQAAGHAARRRGTRVDREALEGSLEVFRGAVAGMCGPCPDNEYDGCRNSTCPLRPVSAIPLATSSKEAERVRRPEPWSPVARANRGAAQRKAWSRDPERPQRQSAAGRERWAALTPGERQEMGHRISVGRRRSAA